MKGEDSAIAVGIGAGLLIAACMAGYMAGKENPWPERVTIISELPPAGPCDCEWKEAASRAKLAVDYFNRDMREQGRPYRLVLAKVDE